MQFTFGTHYFANGVFIVNPFVLCIVSCKLRIVIFRLPAHANLIYMGPLSYLAPWIVLALRGISLRVRRRVVLSEKMRWTIGQGQSQKR